MNIKKKTKSVPSVGETREISKKLNNITKKIFQVNEEIKSLTDKKSDLKKEFYALADEYIEKTSPATRETIYSNFASRGKAEDYVQINFPEWRIIEFNKNCIVIEEDPSKMKFMWSTDDGYEIGRNIAVVGTSFNFENLKENEPELFKEIVFEKTEYQLNENKAREMAIQNPELMSLLQENIKPGNIQLRMSSPKKIKEQ